jgi:hypothetical protein
LEKIDKLLVYVIRKYAADELQSLVSAISDPLGKALAELAKEDPVLAFRLRGIEQFLVLTRKVDNLLAVPASPNSAALENSLSQEFPSVEDFFRDNAVTELRQAIQETAWRCDVLTHLRVGLLLHKIDKEQANGESTQRLRDLADQLLDRFISEQKDSQKPS